MAISNFFITVGFAESVEACNAVGVAAVAYLMKGDVRTGAATFRRNLKHIRGWLEEQNAAASQTTKEEVKKVTDAGKKVSEGGSKPPD